MSVPPLTEVPTESLIDCLISPRSRSNTYTIPDPDDPFELKPGPTSCPAKPSTSESVGVLVQFDSDEKPAKNDAPFDWDLLKNEAQNVAGDLKLSNDRRESLMDWEMLKNEAQCLAVNLKQDQKKK